MTSAFLQVLGAQLVHGGKKVTLRGFGVGSWMNIEHFMFGMPGTERAIRRAFATVYGEESAAQFFDTFLSNVIDEDDFAFLDSLGVNCLRLPFNYRHFEDDQHPFEYREEGFRHLDRVLALCAKHKIWAILDMHAVPGGQNPDWHADNDLGVPLFWYDASLRERTVRLWKYIAARYAENRWIAGYDIVNEPCFVPDRVAFNDFFRRTTEAIRSVDPHHIIWVEGDDWGKDFSLFDDIADAQTACSFHLYPGGYVHSDTGLTPKDALSMALAPLFAIRDRFGRPLWCGETASHDPMILGTMLDLLEQNDCSWTLWAYKDANTVGIVYPKPETPWMMFVAQFRQRWGLGQERQLAREVAEAIAARGFEPMRKNQGLIEYRLRAIFHHLWVDQLVVPALRAMPWDKMRDLPLSFAWANCTTRDDTAALVRRYTGKQP